MPAFSRPTGSAAQSPRRSGSSRVFAVIVAGCVALLLGGGAALLWPPASTQAPPGVSGAGGDEPISETPTEAEPGRHGPPGVDETVWRVEHRADIELPLGYRARAQFGDRPFDGEIEVLAGPGTVDSQRAQGAHLLRVAVGRRWITRVARFSASGTAIVRLYGDRPLRGTVADDAGTPLAGATVWAGVQGIDDDLPGLVETDAAGRFEFDSVPLGAGTPLLAWLPGRAPTYVVFEHDREARREPLLTLEPGVRLQVVLRGQIAEPNLARLMLAPSSRGLGAGRLRQYPFWLPTVPALSGLFGGSQVVGFDESGRATFEGVPRDVPLDLLVVHPSAGRGALRGMTAKRDGQRVSVTVDSSPVRLQAVVVDEGGQPVEGAVVRAVRERQSVRSAERDLGELLAPEAYDHHVLATRTDSNGRFDLALRSRSGSLRLRIGARDHWTVVYSVPEDLPKRLLLPRRQAAADRFESADLPVLMPAPAAADAASRPVPRLVAGPNLRGAEPRDGGLQLAQPALVDIVDAATGRVVHAGIVAVGQADLPPPVR